MFERHWLGYYLLLHISSRKRFWRPSSWHQHAHAHQRTHIHWTDMAIWALQIWGRRMREGEVGGRRGGEPLLDSILPPPRHSLNWHGNTSTARNCLLISLTRNCLLNRNVFLFESKLNRNVTWQYIVVMRELYWLSYCHVRASLRVSNIFNPNNSGLEVL